MSALLTYVTDVPQRIDTWKYAAAVTTIGLGIVLWRRLRGRPSVYESNFEKDMVYLYQFPSSENVPCASPFAMKVETFLRLYKIPYKAKRTVTLKSEKGQIPFIELNGVSTSDSNFILERLFRHFAVKEELVNPEDKAKDHAFKVMMDNQTVWSYSYYRDIVAIGEFIDTFPFLNCLKRRIVKFLLPRHYFKRARQHGIGRNAMREIVQLGFEDLKALSRGLGEKKYFHGDTLMSIDCYIFSHLAQIIDVPLVDYPHREYLQRYCPNLIDHFERVKKELWSDYDEVCKKRSICD